MRILALPLILSLAGCSALGALTAANRDVYELLPADDAPRQCARRAGTEFIIEPPKARTTLDTDRIMIRPGALQAQYLPDAQWGDTAPVTLQTLLVRSFSRFNAFSHVGRTPLGAAGDYALLSEIEDFNAEVTTEGTRVVMTIDAQIVRETDASVVSRGRFVATRPVASSRTADLIPAFDAAAQDLTGQITAWGLSSMGLGCR